MKNAQKKQTFSFVEVAFFLEKKTFLKYDSNVINLNSKGE
jgi:hypothetical protein